MNAALDTTTYDRGIKITDKQIAALEATQLHRHEFHGDWNYTLTAAPRHAQQKPTYLLRRHPLPMLRDSHHLAGILT